jgi:hypothetical protein
MSRKSDNSFSMRRLRSVGRRTGEIAGIIEEDECPKEGRYHARASPGLPS